jgi:hypothetical protein
VGAELRVPLDTLMSISKLTSGHGPFIFMEQQFSPKRETAGGRSSLARSAFN